jgi:hypothetical protein
MKKLIKLALVVGAITAASKMIRAKREEWEGLTEAEVREKIDSRMPERVPDEKREAVKDKVVAGMRKAGRLADEGPTDS